MRADAIFISGMASSGKSTLAKMVAEKYGYRFFAGGDVLKEMASDMGYNVKGDDFWDTDAGMEFLRKREKDENFDKKLDKKLIELAEKGKVVITTWTLPWIYKGGNSVSIWFGASPKVRAERMTKRDKISFDKAVKVIKKRDKKNYEIYKKMYGILLEKDLAVFDLVINTDLLSPEPLFKIITCYIDTVKKTR
ncbi:MAG: cytidylate kinase family protein [Candidatus Nanoarchaeia archaeon]|nr:cytidylate kinase family protein [Candidatus Nanoarchaeia archaeon]